MLWFLIILVLFIFLSYILFAPIYLEANSRTGLLRIRLHRLVSSKVYLSEGSLLIELKILWWNKIFYPLAQGKKKVNEKVKKVKIEKRKFSAKKIIAVAKSFKVNKFYLTIDTGSMQANGILFPLFLWVSHRLKRSISINFINENEIVFETTNNFYRILRAYNYS